MAKTQSITERARKLLLTGIGAMSMGERLPKEAVNYLLDQAEKKKDDLIERLALEVDLHATLRFSGKGNALGNDPSSHLSVKTRRKP